jgi:hypothetical protein
MQALQNFDSDTPGVNGAPPAPKSFSSAIAIPEDVATGLGSEQDDVWVDPGPGSLARAFNRLVGRNQPDDPREYSRMGTTIAGGIAGGMAGGRVPGPPLVKGIGVAIGSVAGTAVGTAAPEVVLEGLEAAGMIKPGERERLGLSRSEMWNVVQDEAFLDMYTLGGVSAARGLGRGITSIMTGANRTSRAMAEGATREGISLMPVQVGDGWFARRMVSVVGRFPWVAGKLNRRGERSMQQIATAFDGIPERLGPLATYDEISGRIIRESQATAQHVSTDFEQQLNTVMARADITGVQVRPVNTRSTTDRLVRELGRMPARGVEPGTQLARTPGDQEMLTFLNRNTRLLSDVQTAGRQAGQSGTRIADMSLRNADNLLRVIDRQMAKFAKASDSTNMGRLEGLRTAVIGDMTTNVVNRSAGASGATLTRGQELVTEFRRIDQEFTEATNLLFASPSARKIGFERSPTGRGAVLDPTRVRGADSMAQILLRSASPESIAEIERIVDPQTMRMISSAVFSTAMEKAMPAVGEQARRIDVDRFAKELGLNAPNSGKAAQTRELLRASGGMTPGELDGLIEVARRASEAELPDVSTFLARSAAFQGLRGTLKAAVPFAAIGAAGKVADGWLTGAMVTALTAGGARLVFNMVSNPASARAWRRVADVEAKTGVRRAAYVRAIGFAGQQMYENGVISQDELDQIRSAVQTGMDELDKLHKN